MRVHIVVCAFARCEYLAQQSAISPNRVENFERKGATDGHLPWMAITALQLFSTSEHNTEERRGIREET